MKVTGSKDVSNGAWKPATFLFLADCRALIWQTFAVQGLSATFNRVSAPRSNRPHFRI